MASFEMNFPDDFLKDLLQTDFDEIAQKSLEECAPILEESMKISCKRVIDHAGESELVDSIKAKTPKKTKTDAWIVSVSPSGYSQTKTYQVGDTKKRTYAVSNVLKAIWKEYGINGRQAPQPFIKNACNNVENIILKKMQEKYEQMVGVK